jgi:L-galactono-1,4-lactone dehydrogenase
LLALIEQHQIPAASPIEQRWTSSSSSPMRFYLDGMKFINLIQRLSRIYFSPAFSSSKDEIFSWVGIIMYLPSSQTNNQRKLIENKFSEYKEIMQPLMEKFNAHVIKK